MSSEELTPEIVAMFAHPRFVSAEYLDNISLVRVTYTNDKGDLYIYRGGSLQMAAESWVYWKNSFDKNRRVACTIS